MDNPVDNYWRIRLENVKKNLENNNFDVFLAESFADVKSVVLETIIPQLKPSSMSWGGSMTFVASGLYDELKAKETIEILDTYDKIRRNFHSMFRRLFGGGRAELRLCDPDNVLDSGIEIFAQPPGKRLENIALLSGGERSLTAVALLFATYMVKPSPFCVLDEIDAALDEENIGRFINILGEFGKSSQFIIITHNKKTVASAKTLLGITMAESGVSQVISVRIESPAMQV